MILLQIMVLKIILILFKNLNTVVKKNKYKSSPQIEFNEYF